ncbi:MAG: hydrogenase formation protein HypD [Planctomycetaceae bacterium]|nr:hydrogenase formation protein HypD [Planctomycetaceae bacterium]
MKYLDEFRDPQAGQRLIAEIRRLATRRWTIMEVCGGQTHSLLRHGIDSELAASVELIHGPGCPVCVTAVEALESARRLSLRGDVTVATFGDMLRVPASCGTLQEARAAGGNVRAVYSPLDAVALARREPDRQVVFFAVGFETTAPATALAVRQAAQFGLANFSLLAAHVRVLPAMEVIAAAPQRRVQGFLAAGHVCTVMGETEYEAFVARTRMPVVVTGFEPVDLLLGIRECVRALEEHQPRVANCYARTAHPCGNQAARQLIDDVYEVCDQEWRGLGTIPSGGLRLRPAWSRFDAWQRWGLRQPESPLPLIEHEACLSGDVLTGRIKPPDCPSFGTACTPEHPCGAPMVSAEGACAAYYRYALPPAAAGV